MAFIAATRNQRRVIPPPHLAPPLKTGGVVRVVAPASPFLPSRFKSGVTWLVRHGFRVQFERGIFSRASYLAGSDDRRRVEFQRAWRDRSTSAIFSARGGYGSMRLFGSGPLVPAHANKIFMGLSDLTVLLNHVSATTGLVTIHGPMLAGNSFLALSEKRRVRLFRSLEKGAPRELRAPIDYRVFSPGVAMGRLWGGNLTMVCATLGTPQEIPFRNAFLFLEEVNELPFRIDRMLTQLEQSGRLSQIRALILGDFLGPKGNVYKPEFVGLMAKRALRGRRIPILIGVRAGHRRNDVWLPIGGPCSITARGERLLLSPLVSNA